MQDDYGFVAKRVYPSEKGLHIEFNSEEEAKAFCRDGRSRGITNYEIEGATVIKKFPVRASNRIGGKRRAEPNKGFFVQPLEKGE